MTHSTRIAAPRRARRTSYRPGQRPSCGRTREQLLAEYWDLAGGPAPEVEITGDHDVLSSKLAASELALGSVSSAATSAAVLAAARGGPDAGVRVDGRRVSAAFRSDRLLRVSGRPIETFAELSGFWSTTDGWVRTHANYPHHRQRLLGALGLPDSADRDDLAAALGGRSALELEELVTGAGGICVAVRSAEAWRAHPQDAAVRTLPLVSWTRVGDAPVRRLSPPPTAPLLRPRASACSTSPG